MEKTNKGEFYNILLDTILLFDAVIVQNIRQKEFLNFFICLIAKVAIAILKSSASKNGCAPN